MRFQTFHLYSTRPWLRHFDQGSLTISARGARRLSSAEEGEGAARRPVRGRSSSPARCIAFFLLASGCASGSRSFNWVEGQVRSTVVDGSGFETVLFEGSARVLMLPERALVVSRGESLVFPEAETGEEAAEPERRATSLSTLWDYKNGCVWVTRDGEELERSLFAQVTHEERNRLRQDRMELLDQFLHSTWLRNRDDLEVCWGDLRVLDGDPIQVNGEVSEVRYIAVEPGEYWEVALTPQGSPLNHIASRESCLAGVLGLSTERAQMILQRLGGMPWRVKAIRVAPGEERQYVRVTTLISAREATEPEQLSLEGSPTQADLDEAEAVDSIVSLESILDLLRAVSKGEQDLPRFASVVGLCLKITSKLRPGDLERVVEACAVSGDALVQVELARLALRASPERAWRSLRPVVVGDAALAAMNVAEASLPSATPERFRRRFTSCADGKSTRTSIPRRSWSGRFATSGRSRMSGPKCS